MIVGCPKEIKDCESRLGLTPAGVAATVNAGHTVVVEEGAGQSSGISDDEFMRAGAEISRHPTIFNEAGTVVKVKEPLPAEIVLGYKGQILFTFLYLVADNHLTQRRLSRKIKAIGHETVELAWRLLSTSHW